MADIVNIEQAEAWDGPEGEHWAAHHARFDASIQPHHRALMPAAALAPGERVLDIGCGNGLTCRDAARAVGPSGEVLGVDLSGPMLARAEQLAKEEGLDNIRFEQGDAQVHPFAPGVYDLAMSRFGVMFFLDPVAAFTNIASALRPGGRLAMLVWQSIAANEWVSAMRGALAVGRDLPVPPPGAPNPFSLADTGYARRTLTEAGFTDVAFAESVQRFHVGSDADDAYGFVIGLKVIQMLVEDVDDATRARALDNLRATMADHQTADGVTFGSAAWIITARKP
ncbi:MAG TPA: methyltransferase domain-containing protein [Acidimicrobiia bacterium]|nr:methyltransferase domain-containing protein [Acidimicrobiia bacterium]